MYKDCIYKQKQLKREELDGENELNAENELNGENELNAEKDLNKVKGLDAKKLDKQPTRKRKQIKVYTYVHTYAVQF